MKRLHKLLVDDRWNGGGIKRFSDELLSRLHSGFQVQGVDGAYPLSDPLTPLKLSLAIRKSAPDVFWSPGFMPPAFTSVPFLFTMHDLIHIHSADRLRSLYYNAVIRPLARNAFKILTVSEFSQGEICEWAGLPQERVPVVSNGVSGDFTPGGNRFDPGYPYLFYVGARKKHKNLETMLLAYSRSGLGGSCRLLLSGSPSETLQALATKLGIANDLRFAGFIPEPELPSYYRGAEAVVMVSTYEGFGLPVLEAMASGVPVLCSNTTSLGEIAGSAALLVDPLNPAQIAEEMRRIVEDKGLRTELVLRGFQRAQLFQWDSSADKLSGLLREACAST